MKPSAPRRQAEEYLQNLKQLESTIKRLEKTADQLHGEIGHTEDVVHKSERDLQASRPVARRLPVGKPPNSKRRRLLVRKSSKSKGAA